MVKENPKQKVKHIPVNRVCEVETVSIKSTGGEQIWFWVGGDQASNDGLTAEMFAKKYKFEAVDGKLRVVESL